MPFRRFNPGCPCCCETIGFEQNKNQGILDCCKPEFQYIENLDANIGRLDECQAVFAGAQNDCAYSTSFDPADWPTIRTWVENGGRLYVGGEYIGCISAVERDNLNDFVAALGTSMRIGSVQCECGCNDDWVGILHAGLPILEGVTAIHHACTNVITGGVWLAMTEAHPNAPDDPDGPECYNIPYIAIEKIGDGYIMMAGDSNIVEGCAYENCAFWKNFVRRETLL